MASLGYIVGMVILAIFAGIGILGLLFLFVWGWLLPRFRPGAAEFISGFLVRFIFKRLPGDGLSAHMDGGRQFGLRPFEVDEDGMIWLGGVPYMTVDEAPVGSAFGVPLIATYRGFAGLVNMGLARVGEEIERIGYVERSSDPDANETVAADGGATAGAMEVVGYDSRGEEVDIPDHAAVDTSKIQYVDSNASVPDKAARAVKNAVAAERVDERSPMKQALIYVGLILLGAGIPIFTLILIGSVGGTSLGV